MVREIELDSHEASYRGNKFKELVESEDTVVYHTNIFEKEVQYVRKNEYED